MNEQNNVNPDNTALAKDRTVLANERTFQAWIRTGLSALATGMGVAKFLKESMPLWMLLTITTILIGLSMLAFMQATWRYSHLHIRMADLEVQATPIWVVKLISLALIICALLALIGMYIEAIK